jgi:nitrogen fixation protein FixH
VQTWPTKSSAAARPHGKAAFQVYVVPAASRSSARAAALGCRAHTGWAVLVVVAGGIAQPEVVLRCRAELGDPSGRVRRNAYQAARTLERPAAAALVEAAERIAAEQAAAALERTLRQATDDGAVVRSCAVVVGSDREARLESILASHALAHAAEGRLYQAALLKSAESRGLDAIAIPKRTIFERAEVALGVAADELRPCIDQLRRELGPPWAQDQKLAALAAWIALAQSSERGHPSGFARSGARR